MNSYDLCVIGAGPGGISAAVRGVQRGARVCLIDPGPLGGTCLNRGCIPSRTLGTTARFAAQVRHADRFGLEVTHFRLDLAKVLLRKERIVRRFRTALTQLLDRHHVTWLQGEGILQGPHEVSVSMQGTATGIRAKSIILATGSRPSSIPGVTPDGKVVITSNEILDLETVPNSLLIIGAGVIGCEFASYFADIGVPVVLVEAAQRILPGTDSAVSEAFRQTLHRRGVKILTGVQVKSVSHKNSSGTVTLTNGQVLTSALILIAAGRTPVFPKGTREQGVKIGKGETLVDETLRSSTKSIFCIGDLLSEYQLASTARYEGSIAAHNALGADRHVDYTGVPEPIYTEPEIALVGLSSDEAKKDGDYHVSRLNFFSLARAQTLEETDGFVQIVSDRKTGRLKGVQIMGPRATDLIGEAALAIKHEMTLSDLEAALHGHPTLSEALWETASLALGNSLYYAEND